MKFHPQSSASDIHDIFPLAPFLLSLATIDIRPTLRDYERISRVLRTGGRWDIERLRFTLVALLVRNPDQEIDFRRRFDSFFQESQIEADLETNEQAPTQEKVVSSSSTNYQPPPPAEVEEKPKVDEEPFTPVQTAETTPQPSNPPTEDYSRFPFGFAVCNGEVVGETFKLPGTGEAPIWDEKLPRLFRPGIIGGKPAPRLDNETLDQLADSMGYFQNEQVGSRLDVHASIRATANGGGFPTLMFQRRKQIRNVLILEDTYAEALTWNPIAGELAQGLARRGVPVVYGHFQGVPDRFLDLENGRIVHLDDLEDQRRGYLLLIFSDGKGLHYRDDRFTLEALTHWPMMAWMELREPRAWDESSALPAHVGLPVYPASKDGLLTVMRRFMTEQGSRGVLLNNPTTWCGLPARELSVPLAIHVERLLGNALLWAQDCAMMLPPLSLGLADALRKEFHPQLPPERIERLYNLPGTTWNTSGLQFSQSVLAVLRRGFVLRRSEARQQKALEFLLRQIQQAEPENEHSPAHFAWEWRRERVRLELEPDLAVQRLTRFAQSPLGEAIRAELGRVVFPDSQSADPDAIPLRLKPRNQLSVKLFGLIQDDNLALPGAWLGYSFQDRLRDDSLGPEMVVIPAGEFMMGSPEDEAGRFEDECWHQVIIKRPFAIGKYTVTFEEYDCFAEATGHKKPGDVGWGRGRRPVINIIWYDALAYTEWLSEQTGRQYRLPTEAEWEYAARAGTQTAFHFGNTISTGQANYGPDRRKTVEVGQFAANAWGLYDVHGNVWEWTGSAYDRDYRGGELRYANKANSSPGVLRGGSWLHDPRWLRGAARFDWLPHDGSLNWGFRLARTL
ncbi:MAG: formylglycine-generating enzyme family protein [Candidatus Competibacteraceae bacterium]